MADNPTHIKDLVPDPDNRRKHTPRNVGMLVDSLQKVGAGRSIVIDENNEILAGNATIEAAGEVGITKVRVIEADGNEVIAVKREGLTDSQKRELALYDNRTAELAEWDVEQLQKDIDSDLDMSSFFSDDELGKLIDEHEKKEKEAVDRPEVDFSPELDFESNYVVLKFDKDIDALYMQEVFGLKTVKSRHYLAKDGTPLKMGVGRIVDGMEGIEKIKTYFENQK